jgi:hypothetical protein
LQALPVFGEKMAKSLKAYKLMDLWFSELPKYKSSGNLPARGSIAAALIVLERLKNEYVLDLNAHLAEGKAQIQGLSTFAVKKILSKFGEQRIFLTEGGRTNRGNPGAIDKLLNVLNDANLDKYKKADRNAILEECQKHLIGKVEDYLSAKHLEFLFDSTLTSRRIISDLLAQAKSAGKGGPVAQYLVGAKLQLRFQKETIENQRYSAGDVQTRRSGDFELGDTILHVTVAPNMNAFEKCKKNIEKGYRVFLIVPEASVAGSRQIAESILPGKIAVEPLESFIANNLEELSCFTKKKLVSGFRRLLELYNSRVKSIEPDKSLLINIPRALE